jgi:hypothetical protein
MPLSDPGFVNDVVFGADVDPDWGNAMRDRTVQHFASAAARDAAITSPTEGMACWLNDVDQFLIYNGVAWRQPWSQPWGEQAYAETTTANTDIGGAEADMVTALTFTAVANRKYIFEFFCANLLPSNTAAGDFVKVFLTDNANAHVALLGQRGFDDTSTGLSSATQRTAMRGTARVLGVTAGSKTYKVRGVLSVSTGARARFSASSTADPGPMYCRVVDDGPNGAAA